MNSARTSGSSRFPNLFVLAGLAFRTTVFAAAFISSPSFDNLVVGWPVYALQGIDALGELRQRPIKFALVLPGETAVSAALSAGSGFSWEQFKSTASREL